MENKQNLENKEAEVVKNPEHEKLIQFIVNESITGARLEGDALEAILAQIDRPTKLQ